MQEVPADLFSVPVCWEILTMFQAKYGKVMKISIQALCVSFSFPQESGHLDIYNSNYGGNTECCSRNPNAENSGQYFLTLTFILWFYIEDNIRFRLGVGNISLN